MATETAIAYESLPGIRELFRELDSAGPDPLVQLIRGRSGTGKSTLLAAIRSRLRGRGIGTSGGVIGTFDSIAESADPRSPLIVDDAHTLPPDELAKLCAAVESGCRTVIIATQPRPHVPALRALTDAVARHGRVIEQRPLGVTDIAPFARELGMMVPRPVAQHIHERTAGIHGGVLAALSAASTTRLDAGFEAVDAAVTTWARALLDDTGHDLLDAFVIAATGAGLDPTELTEVLDTTDAAAVDLIDRARASALVTDADLLLAPAVAPLRTLVGDRRFLMVLRRLLQSRLAAGLLRDNTALLLAESGVRDPRLAEFLCAAAEKAGGDAVRYYRAAAAGGTGTGWQPAPAMTVRWAEAAARLGDGDRALRLTEPILAAADSPVPELAAAVRVCAGVWTRRGLVSRAAQLYSWLGPHRVGADWAVGATVFYLAGDVESAAAMSASAALWPPTETTTRASVISSALARSLGLPDHTKSGANGSRSPSAPDGSAAHGTGDPAAVRDPAALRDSAALHDSAAVRTEPDELPVADPAAPASGDDFTPVRTPSEPVVPERNSVLSAASELIRASRADIAVAGADRFLPCAAVSIATLLCLSMGEPRRAADALRSSAPRPEPSGATRITAPNRAPAQAHDPHLLVLSAWTSMLGGDEQSAAQIVAALDFDALPVRDRLLAHGVRVGLARRGGDRSALTPAWQAAYPLFDEVGADLLTLLPIGELWLAGIRLRDESRVTPLVDAARTLLHRLGDPPAWANAFHWYAVQAAIARESPDELLLPAQRLRAAARTGDAHAAALADAGRTWVLILRGRVAPDEVSAAVRRLAGIGMVWDAARLAGEAALAIDDSDAATALLKLARTIRTEARPLELPIRPPEPAHAPRPDPAAGSDILSEREREVAELVLLGLTYREIGARLYISAKTVEHHVARIRRRIGAGSRSELLSMLRAMGHGSLLV
ncbi:LuxR C-terminal-related transcriptional regulator [Nocardia sp. BMG51109]|uniref:LuxR C-terminal-related transcriptional regulator n=1 Tax=Nocardia sp. BMG51109 TaxID=1056816 RepID=UPI000467CC08|nr:LuxR C-terminal-related transcriptional regulator [Nocardia sp. BMG51109]